MNKDIQAYFNKIGLHKVTNIEAEIKKVFGLKAADLIEEYSRIFDERDENNHCINYAEENVSRQKEVVDFIHSSFKMCMIFASAYDQDVYEKCMEFFLTNKRSFGKEILDFGCGNGIVACFVAKMLPKSHVTGIDESANAIHTADEIKKRLKLNNVDFMTSDDYNQDHVDTLISVRTFHENVPQFLTSNSYIPYSKIMQDYTAGYQPFISSLVKCIKPGGNLYCFERNPHYEFPAIAIDLEKIGMSVDFSSYKPYICREALEYSKLFALSARKDSKTQDVEMQLDKILCEKIPYGYSGIYAQKLLETIAGNVIDAFMSVNKENTVCGLHAQYIYLPDPTKFILYQQNENDVSLQIFDAKEDTEEAQQLFAEQRIVEKNNGFTLINIYKQEDIESWINKFNTEENKDI